MHCHLGWKCLEAFKVPSVAAQNLSVIKILLINKETVAAQNLSVINILFINKDTDTAKSGNRQMDESNPKTNPRAMTLIKPWRPQACIVHYTIQILVQYH